MLRPDEIQDINKIAQQIATKESEAMGKLLEATSKKLEAEITDLAIKIKGLEAETMDLKAEIKKAVQPGPVHIETPKKDKRR